MAKRIENHVVKKTTQQGSQETTQEQQVGLGQQVDLEMETLENHTATSKTQEPVPRTLGTKEKSAKGNCKPNSQREADDEAKSKTENG